MISKDHVILELKETVVHLVTNTTKLIIHVFGLQSTVEPSTHQQAR